MSKKVSVRLGDEDFEELQNRSQATNLDFSFLIRDAVSKYLNGNSQAQEKQHLHAGLVMPEEAFALCGPYRAWSGDLRKELLKRLKDMLALAYSAADQYPRTAGIREAYIGILSTYYQLNGRGHGE